MSTAAVIIIGNEILTGKFPDENAPYLIARLRELGVDLARVIVIPDGVDTIAAEVAQASAAFDHVFTTGGVGPTHDDLTMAGIAAAFGVPLVRSEILASTITERMTERAGPAGLPAAELDVALRMADIPAGAELWWDGEVRFPLVVMHNVAIFPGVPALLRLKFEAVAHRYAGTRVECRRLWTLSTEPAIADALTAAANRWPEVAIGSYPRFELTPPRVLVTMEGRDTAALEACLAWLSAAFPTTTPP